MKHIAGAVLFLYLCSGAAWAQTQIISQVVDGDVWQTTIVLTNTTAASANASMTFFKDTSNYATQPWNLTFLEGISPQAITLAAGETLLLHTPGPSPTLTQGFGQIVADPGVQVYAIFTKNPPGLPAQVGTSPAVASATRILVPFDNTHSNVAAMALVNNSAAAETISVNIRTTAGMVTQATLPPIPAQGHAAFTFPSQFTSTAGASGLAEFYVSSGTFAILALSFNPAGSLTTAPIYNESGPPIIMGSGSAGAVTVANFAIAKLTSTSGFPPGTPELTEKVSGGFASYSPAEWALQTSGPTFGPCSVLQLSYPLGTIAPSTPDGFLDAGTLTVTGPGLSGTTVTKTTNSQGATYALTPAAGTIALGGTYTLTGSGGTQVGPFTASATLPSSFTVTNWDSITSVNRANPLTVSWTGTGFDVVVIHVQGVTIGSTISNVLVSCPVAANLGTYTIPAAALALLPATSTGQLSLAAGLTNGGTITPLATTAQTLTPSLVGGGSVNYGSFSPTLITTKTIPVQ
jgi:hypothetical protein